MEPAISGGPGAEFHDPERVRLIGKILRALRELEISQGADPGSWPPLSELAWSCLWLSDMKSLANITTRFEENPSELHLNLRSRFAAAGFEALCRYSSPAQIAPDSLTDLKADIFLRDWQTLDSPHAKV